MSQESRNLNTEKRAYVKPAFEMEDVFETMALACQANNPNSKLVNPCTQLNS